MSRKKKPREPFNYDNHYWHKKLPMLMTKEALDTMKFIGCDSRGVYLMMAIRLANKTYGENK